MKRIVWTGPAKADVGSLSKPVAMQILSPLHRFAESGVGDVKALQGREELRCASVITDFCLSALISMPSRFSASIIAAKRIAEMSYPAASRPPFRKVRERIGHPA